MFRDRAEAAGLLAERLTGYATQHPLVLAVPRGAVVMGRIIAEKLGGDLDVVLVRKLRAPTSRSSRSAPWTRAAGPTSPP